MLRWRKIFNELVEVNNFPEGTGIKDPSTDIMIVNSFYAEPKINYEDQEEYWQSKSTTMKSMAHDSSFSKKDLNVISKFL